MGVFDKLKYIEIETHSACTRKCTWCLFGAYPDFRPKTQAFLDEKLITDIFLDLKLNGFCGVIGLFSIDEPLMDERIVNGKLIRTCREILGNNVCITITTNGDLLTKELADFLFSYGLDFMKISCYEKSRYLKMKKIFSNCNNVFVLDQTRYIDGKYESNRGGALMLKSEVSFNSCFFPQYRITIGWDGELRICYHDILQKMKIGNIKSRNLFDILTDTEFLRTVKTIECDRQSIVPCNNCNVRGNEQKMLKFNHEIEKYMIKNN